MIYSDHAPILAILKPNSRAPKKPFDLRIGEPLNQIFRRPFRLAGEDLVTEISTSKQLT